MDPSQQRLLNFRPNVALPAVSTFCHNAALQIQNPSEFKTQPKCSNSFLCCILEQSTSHHLAFFTTQRFTLPAAYFYKKDERAHLATFIAILCLPYHHGKYNVSQYNPVLLFLLSFSVLKRFIGAIFWLIHTGFLNNFSISNRPASGDRGRPVCLNTIAKSVHNFKFSSQFSLFAII